MVFSALQVIYFKAAMMARTPIMMRYIPIR
jgi:hypothetical protein